MKARKRGIISKKYRKRLSNNSIKKTLRHTFASLIFVAIALVLFCFAGLQVVSHLNKRLTEGPVVISAKLSEIKEGVAETNILNYDAILGNITADELASAASINMQNVQNDIAELEQTVIEFNDPMILSTLDYIEDLKNAVSDYGDFGLALYNFINEGRTQTAQEIFSQYKGIANGAVDDSYAKINEIIETKTASYSFRISGVIRAIGVILLLISALCTVTAVFIVRNLCAFLDGSLDEMLNALEKVSEGDLNAKINLSGDNEFVHLAENLSNTISNIKLYIEKEKVALTLMAEKDVTVNIEEEFSGDFAPMRDAVNDISAKYNEFLLATRDSATDVSEAANNMSSASSNLASASTQQAASVQELLAIIEDLNSNVEKVANSAREMSNNSLEDNKQLLAGNEKMNELVEAMDKIEKSSKMISGIVDMIEEIARKTSMLSLNASIEAARAGEQGKGFAVVASEIRSLADASTEAVHKITELVDTSLDAVSKGSSIASDTADLFENIVSNGEAHVQITKTISDDCSNQSDTLHSVMCGVQEIAATVENNSQLAEEVSAISESLFKNARLMTDELNLFKLSDARVARA